MLGREKKIIVEGNDTKHNIRRMAGFRPDVQVFYEFEKYNGKVKKLKIDIKHGTSHVEIAKKIIKILEIASEIKALSVNDGKSDRLLQAAAFEETKNLIDGSWQGEAQFLIANIALRV